MVDDQDPLYCVGGDDPFETRRQDLLDAGEYPEDPGFCPASHYHYLASLGATHEQILVTLTEEEIVQLKEFKMSDVNKPEELRIGLHNWSLARTELSSDVWMDQVFCDGIVVARIYEESRPNGGVSITAHCMDSPDDDGDYPVEGFREHEAALAWILELFVYGTYRWSALAASLYDMTGEDVRPLYEMRKENERLRRLLATKGVAV